MAHKIEFVENSEIIRVTYSDKVDLDERIYVVHELCTDYRVFKTFKLLIDVRYAAQDMTQAEQIVFGNYIASREEFNMALVAILDNPEHSINQIINKESTKKGYKIKPFNLETAAITWLNLS